VAIVASGQITLIDLNDSKQLVSYIGASQAKTVIYNPNNGQYIPNYASTPQVLTPQLFIAGSSQDLASQSKSVKWYYRENSGGDPVEITESDSTYELGTDSVKTLTIKSNVLASAVTMTYICEMVFTDPDTGFDVITKADIELVKVTNGQKGADGQDGRNAIMAVLTNDSHVIPTDKSGGNGNYTGANTTIVVYEGVTDVSSSWTASATASSGVTGTLNGKTYTVTNMTTDTGYVDITVSRSGYASITKRFNLSKSKRGEDGTTPTTYWLISNVPAIAKTRAGSLVPSKVTVSAKSQIGAGSPIAYSGRFRISESTDGTTFTAKYTSSSDQSFYEYTPSTTNIKALKVELFLAGGTSNLLDEQIIPVVTDGSDGRDGRDGIDSVIATVWTPDGNMIRNHEGTLKATVTVYKGTTEVTPSAFKWYIQDPTATTSSGGDADGGNGWRLLTSTWNAGVTGYTTATITIPASAIAGVESFKCVVTYDGNKYKDVCTVIDVTDPIVVSIIGLNTFKNGQGESSYTAKLYRNGMEIDTSGTEFTYKWYLYKENGQLDTEFGTKTGKTITVKAEDFYIRANLVCEVSK
jgi:hypothetical protein